VLPRDTTPPISLTASAIRGRGVVAGFVDRVRLDLVLAAVLGLLALGAGLYQVDGNSLWLDEAFAARLALLPWPVLWNYIWGPYSHSALYLVLLHVYLYFTSLVGIAPTEFVVRLPSVICVALSTMVVFRFGWQFVGKAAATLGTTIYLLSFLVLQQGDQVGSAGLELLVVSLSWYTLLAALTEESEWQWWLAYVLMATLQVYIQFFGILVLAAQVATFVFLRLLPSGYRDRARRAAIQVALSLLAVLLLASPILYDAIANPSADGWIPVAQPSTIEPYLVVLAGSAASLVPLLAALGLLELLVVAGHYLASPSNISARFTSWLRHALGGRDPSPSNSDMPGGPLVGIVALCLWLALPIVLAYAFTQPYLNAHLFFYTYFGPLAAAYCLLAGFCVTVARWRYVQVIAAFVLIFLTVQSVPTAHTSANFDAWRPPALWLEQSYVEGDGIICTPAVECAVPLDYYFAAYPSQAHFDAESPGAFDWQAHMSNPTDTAALAAYAAHHQRLFLVSYSRPDSGPGSVEAAQNAAVQGWLDQHDRVWQQTSASTYLSTITVTLYVR
jgi:mannosyltransferase